MEKTEVNFDKVLQRELIAEGLFLDFTACDLLKRHYDILNRWQNVHNLTAIERILDLVRDHYIDCIKGFSFLSKQPEVFDFGTGAGFPGLIGAVLWPNSCFTLIEASQKKCSFLAIVVAEMGLKNVKILNKRVERLSGVPFAISRATFSINLLVNAQKALVSQGKLALWLSEKQAFQETETPSSLGFTLINEYAYSLGKIKNRRIRLMKKNEKCFT